MSVPNLPQSHPASHSFHCDSVMYYSATVIRQQLNYSSTFTLVMSLATTPLSNLLISLNFYLP